MSISKLAAAALAATVAAAPFAAHAASMNETIIEGDNQRRAAEVSYADLNLASAADVDQLSDRVRRAAKRVCSVAGTRSLELKVKSLNCRKEAMNRAEAQIAEAVKNVGNTQMAARTTITVALP